MSGIHDYWSVPPSEQGKVREQIDNPVLSPNPCVNLYGPGPLGCNCKTCVHLLRLEYHNVTYRKCDLREITHGKGSDHKASYPACAKYEPEPEKDRYEMQGLRKRNRKQENEKAIADMAAMLQRKE